MKCATHNADATGLCPYCGKALCPSCTRSGSGQRTACSDVCAAALSRADKAADMVIRKSVQIAKASAIACYLSGALFILTGAGAYFTFRGLMFLPLFTGSLGLALILCGYWYAKASRQQVD